MIGVVKELMKCQPIGKPTIPLSDSLGVSISKFKSGMTAPHFAGLWSGFRRRNKRRTWGVGTAGAVLGRADFC